LDIDNEKGQIPEVEKGILDGNPAKTEPKNIK
jgi:hypothetical protein